jgi:hypothetical protein
MTVAISCNLSDGVILGVDSAVTVPVGDHLKIWEHAEKLFQMGDRPIGAAIYGLAGFGERSVGSYFREFQEKNPNQVLSSRNDVADVVEALRSFMDTSYRTTIAAAITAAGRDFGQELQAGTIPALGIVVGGFSTGQYVPELWQLLIPYHTAPNSALKRLDRGANGVTWYSMYEPIVRYINGYDQNLIFELRQYIEGPGMLGRTLTAPEQDAVAQILSKYQYTVPFASMPIEQGIEYVRFLVDFAIKHYHFSSGFAHQPWTEKVVGGRVRLGVVTYKGESFRILD